MHDTGDMRQETGDRRQETGDRRQETGDRRQETGDRRQETGDRRQETGTCPSEFLILYLFAVSNPCPCTSEIASTSPTANIAIKIN